MCYISPCWRREIPSRCTILNFLYHWRQGSVGHVYTTGLQHNCVCHPGGHYCNNYFGTLFSSYVAAIFQSRAVSRFAPSQWETALLCNDVSHWLCTRLESALPCIAMTQLHVHDSVPGLVANIRHPSETHLKLKSRKISFAHNLFISYLIDLKFCTVILPCSEQNSKAIEQLAPMLWATEISRDLSLRWVSHGYRIFHSTPGVLCTRSPRNGYKATYLFKTLLYVCYILYIYWHIFKLFFTWSPPYTKAWFKYTQ